MSRRRNRNRSVSFSASDVKKPMSAPGNNRSFAHTHNRSTLFSYQDKTTMRQANEGLDEAIYNRNVAHFRQSFNSNDPSQLPFMSSLRQHLKLQPGPRNTTVEPFDVALKETCNQTVKKRVSDFKAKTFRLSPAYYRWHNQSGRNNLWGSEFECSLRDYGDSKNPQQLKYYSYIKPIVYKDVEPREYTHDEMICDRHRKSFRLK